MDENSPVRNQVLVGLGVLVAVALLVGGIVGLVALKAVDVAGLSDGGSGGTEDSGPPLGIGTNDRPADPTSEPTTQPPSSPTQTTGSTTSSPEETTKTKKPPRERNVIALNASPQSAGTYERVNLTGTYRRGEGATLQVQRKEGGSWVDFPTDAYVSGGTFSTYIETGRPGANKFRVVDTSTGRASNVVTIQIS